MSVSPLAVPLWVVAVIIAEFALLPAFPELMTVVKLEFDDEEWEEEVGVMDCIPDPRNVDIAVVVGGDCDESGELEFK